MDTDCSIDSGCTAVFLLSIIKYCLAQKIDQKLYRSCMSRVELSEIQVQTESWRWVRSHTVVMTQQLSSAEESQLTVLHRISLN